MFLSEDSGMSTEWHFFAISRGNSAFGGVGGTLKRLAAEANLQQPYNDQITTPQ
jgi:hypothetical protein